MHHARQRTSARLLVSAVPTPGRLRANKHQPREELRGGYAPVLTRFWQCTNSDVVGCRARFEFKRDGLRLPEKEAVGLMDQYGASLASLLDQLAKRKLIRPMMTQGHIRDLYKNRIIVDAMTTQGSSGTPMFGETGKVIGVTFANLADDPTSNFAAEIKGAIEQLRIAGWTAPDH